MATLAISSGKYGSEYVTIKEEDVWKIDKYTMSLEDSNEVRDMNLPLFQQFQRLYPNAGRGSVRLFLPSVRANDRSEWLVFYKKHKLVLPQILSDIDFMEYYIDGGTKYLKTRDICSISELPDRLGYYMISFCENLKYRDNRNYGITDGGPLYYGFMRDILYRYNSYSNRHREVKSIDQLYAEYYKNIYAEPNFLMGSRKLGSPSITETATPSLDSYKSDEPDSEIYYAMDNYVPRYSELQGFLSSPNFDRYYGNIFEDSYLFILGSTIENYDQKEIYKQWYEYGKNGFDGTVVCPALSKNVADISQFDKSSITFFCIFQESAEVEKNICRSLLNGTEVIIFLYDETLYIRYAKKYPQATILLPRTVDPDQLLDSADSFMIHCYSSARGKRYQI